MGGDLWVRGRLERRIKPFDHSAFDRVALSAAEMLRASPFNGLTAGERPRKARNAFVAFASFTSLCRPTASRKIHAKFTLFSPTDPQAVLHWW